MGIVYLDGEYYHKNEAKISIFDRSILFGDSVYEVIPVYDSKPCFLELHLKRLNSNLEKLKFNLPLDNWPTILQELIRQNGGGHLQLYVQVTRGNQGVRKQDIPKDLKPTCFAFTLHNAYPTLDEKRQGLHARLVEDLRWLRCDIKTNSLLGNILLNDEALVAGADVAILFRNGFLTEGSAANVFIVDKEGMIKTPPLTNLCLPGITRQITIELISKLKLPFIEEPISIQSFLNASEIWITSTTKEIYPIASVDGISVNRNNDNPFWEQLHNEYQLLIK